MKYSLPLKKLFTTLSELITSVNLSGTETQPPSVLNDSLNSLRTGNKKGCKKEAESDIIIQDLIITIVFLLLKYLLEMRASHENLSLLVKRFLKTYLIPSISSSLQEHTDSQEKFKNTLQKIQKDHNVNVNQLL